MLSSNDPLVMTALTVPLALNPVVAPGISAKLRVCPISTPSSRVEESMLLTSARVKKNGLLVPEV